MTFQILDTEGNVHTCTMDGGCFDWMVGRGRDINGVWFTAMPVERANKIWPTPAPGPMTKAAFDSLSKFPNGYCRACGHELYNGCDITASSNLQFHICPAND